MSTRAGETVERLLKNLSSEDRFEIEGEAQLHTDIRSYSCRPLEHGNLVALTLNDVACRLGEGLFYWLPSLASSSQQRVAKKEMLRTAGMDNAAVELLTSSEAGHADMLFLPTHAWTEDDRKRWLSMDAESRQTLCQGQLNWWDAAPVLVLPIYIDIVSRKSWSINAGPRLAVHDGALLIYEAVDRGSKSHQIYLDTLQGFRSAAGQAQGSGTAFSRTIRYRPKGQGASSPPMTAQWAQKWFAEHEVRPNTHEELVRRLSAMSNARPQLLERWSDAIERTYV